MNLAEGRASRAVYRLKTATVALRVSEPAPDAEPITDAHRAASVAQAVFDDLDADQEHFAVFALDVKNRPRAFKVLFSGGMNQSIVDPKIVYRWALLFGANRLIAAHNHPSGDPTPSAEDHKITDRLTQAGESLGLELVDHVIIGADRFYTVAGAREVPLPSERQSQ